jgi:hypothetical protein
MFPLYRFKDLKLYIDIMPTLNVDENIQKITEAINQMSQEILRLEGSLRVFRGFKEAGLTEVDVPLQPPTEAEAEPEAEAEAAPEEEVKETTE